MGGKYVKNTMVEAILRYVAPHLCSGCSKTGSLLCHNCKYNIISEPYSACFVCGLPELRGICRSHGDPVQGARIVALHTGPIETLLEGLKFKYKKAAAYTVAEILHESLPVYPHNSVVTTIPTLSSHIRQRGYDHVALIAKQFAVLRGFHYEPLLTRANKATQHRLNRMERIMEAKRAFVYRYPAEMSDTPIILLDDIITTGSTIREAARVLSREHKTLFVAALAYHPLD